MLIKYATLHGAYLLQHEQYVQAATVFARHGTSTQPPNLQMYRYASTYGPKDLRKQVRGKRTGRGACYRATGLV
jgi:hypothetical protein